MNTRLKLLASVGVAVVIACSGRAASPSALPVPNAGSRATAAVSASSSVLHLRRACPRANWNLVRCQVLIRTDVQPKIGKPPAGWYPADFWRAYGLPAKVNGAGQTVAIVVAHAYPGGLQQIQMDLNDYRGSFDGLGSCEGDCLTVLNGKGGKKLPKQSDDGWGLETALDVQMVSAVCPLCKIVVYEAKDDSPKQMEKAVLTAKGKQSILSLSWGTPNLGTLKPALYDDPNVVFVAAAGDDGYGPLEPAAFPTVISVGGTVLALSSSTFRGYSEVVWPDTGSACLPAAKRYYKPGWQQHTGNSGCANRMMNDTAAVAYGVPVVYKGAWYLLAGTSISTPIIAGVYALAGNAANLGRAAGGALWANTPYTNWDVTQGSNGNCPSQPYFCTAQVGYDGPTGFGTPEGVGAF